MKSIFSKSDAANLLIELIKSTKMKDTQFIILGGSINKNDLLKALEDNPFSENLFNEGILFVPQVYSNNNFYGFAHHLTIEGIGSSPEKAIMNRMAGGYREEIHEIGEALDYFIKDKFVDMFSDYTRRKDKEVGFFMKVDSEGKWDIKDQYFNINMNNLRKSATTKYMTLLTLSNKKYWKSLTGAKNSQRFYYNLFENYQDLFRAKKTEARFAKILELRKGAINDLEKAQQYAIKAKKWSDISKGISLATNILSIGTAIVKASYNSTMESALNNANTSIKDLEDAISQMNKTVTITNSFTLEINTIIRETTPNTLIPDAKLELY